jgi:hypothetical protein
MIRLLFGLLLALGLALSPVAASPSAGSMNQPDCGMGGEMPDMPADHAKKDCCTTACQAPAAAALLPRAEAELPQTGAGLDLSWAAARALASVPNSGLDPPPRT